MHTKTPKLLEDMDHRIVWSTIVEKIPALLAEVESLLRMSR